MRKRTYAAALGLGALIVLSGGVSGPSAAFATGGHGHGHTPVTICHHGKTITVDDDAVPGHLGHGDTVGECQPVSTPEPTAPTPVPPTAVIEPRVQDYVTCTGAAFVLDNSGSTVDVRYVVAGRPFDVAAGAVVHTDADGYRFPTDIGPYTITTYPGDRAWTFAPPTCPTTPPTSEPSPSVTPPTGEPTTPAPSDESTIPAPGSPSPTDGTTPPAPSGTATQPSVPAPASTVATSSAAPDAASTSDGSTTRELAYTGLDRARAIALVVVALGLLALGGAILTIRTRAYRRDDA